MPKTEEKKPLEMRTYDASFEKRDDAAPGRVSGRPVVIGSRTDLGWFDEIIERGALDETNLNDVRL